jgi:hypothetical protein
MRQETRLLKLEARTQHIADERDGPPRMIGKPFYVHLAEYVDWLKASLKKPKVDDQTRQMFRNTIEKMREVHGDWTVEQGWRHHNAGRGRGDDRLDDAIASSNLTSGTTSQAGESTK